MKTILGVAAAAVLFVAGCGGGGGTFNVDEAFPEIGSKAVCLRKGSGRWLVNGRRCTPAPLEGLRHSRMCVFIADGEFYVARHEACTARDPRPRGNRRLQRNGLAGGRAVTRGESSGSRRHGIWMAGEATLRVPPRPRITATIEGVGVASSHGYGRGGVRAPNHADESLRGADVKRA